DHRQVLGLDQGHVALAAPTAVSVAGQSRADRGLGAVDLVHGHVAGRTQPDPLHLAGTRQGRHQLAKGAVRGRTRGRCRHARMLASRPMPPLPAPPVTDHFLPYLGQLETRPVQQVDLVVIHCTELPDLATAREYGERVLCPSGTGNRGHYYIDRDGHTVRYVPEDRVAHHVRGYNARSIGIELVNRGRWPHWLDSRH